MKTMGQIAYESASHLRTPDHPWEAVQRLHPIYEAAANAILEEAAKKMTELAEKSKTHSPDDTAAYETAYWAIQAMKTE